MSLIQPLWDSTSSTDKAIALTLRFQIHLLVLLYNPIQLYILAYSRPGVKIKCPNYHLENHKINSAFA